jgi:transposase
MRQYSKEIPERTMGLDLGDKYSHFYLIDREGEELESGRVAMTASALEKKFRELASTRVVIEAGTHSPWVSRLVEECGHEVLVANPRKVALIAKNQRKSDRIDPRLLARLGRFEPELLFPLKHRGKQAQADLGVIRSRDALVGVRSELINHVRGAVKSMGGRLGSCAAESFHRRVGGQVPEALRQALEPLLQQIEQMTEQIRAYDRLLEQKCEEAYPETKVMRQIKGVGAITSLAFVLTLEDPQRFRQSRVVGSYLGLVPRQQDSGEQQPQLRISKEGDGLMRRLLVGCAHYILGPFGPDSDLRQWGLKLAERGGKNAKKRAAVAVARKLAVLLHHLWATGEVYEPFYHSQRPWQQEVTVARG